MKKKGIKIFVNVCNIFSTTFLYQIMPLDHDFLQRFAVFSSCYKESANISADFVPTQNVLSFDMVQPTDFDDRGCQSFF